ncbi:hypothetical protein KSC_063190 [Ktedonobacter sp. SOSP1-52]|uniref:TniQ family protein n=1 Tax=Ktedonobacter sp. SOSP1-52 TaxID=2778366 RepID=UPI001A2704C4|nr:TniQ family protein [Ktedonobacter sp. SOSP1-52]GHO67427.1 hypothetical protein KSC_063190 [Ktedonobacter sp. SOSP1-52]
MAFLESESIPGHCSHCGIWLGLSKDAEATPTSANDSVMFFWKKWAAKTVGEMLAVTPTLSHHLKKEDFTQNLAKYIELTLQGNTTHLARQLQLDRSTIKDWEKGKQRPQLTSLLKLCNHLGISLVSLLTEEKIAFNSHLYIPIPIKPSNKKNVIYSPIDDDLLRQELENELASNGIPRSKEQIMKGLGYNPYTASQHFPELCRKITERYQVYQKSRHKENIQNMINDVRQATYRVHEQGEYPSTIRISQFMQKPKSIRLLEVNAAWHEVLQELGWEEKTPITKGPIHIDADANIGTGKNYEADRKSMDPQKVIEVILRESDAQNSNTNLAQIPLLEPIGLGTFYTESFTSYFARLANAHKMNVRDFIIQLVIPTAERLYLLSRNNDYSLANLWRDSASLNSTHASLNEWFRALECIGINHNLNPLTMMPWGDVLAQKELMRHNRTWCPLCLDQWRKEGKTLFEPLFWMLEAISICPIHLRRLEVQCPHQDCQKRLSVLAPTSRPGYCSECDQPLYMPSLVERDTSVEDNMIWHQWVAKSTGEMIATAPNLLMKPSKEKIAANVMACVNQVTGGNVFELSRKVNINASNIYSWKSGRFIGHSLLLQLCFSLDISPVQFLTEETITINPARIKALVTDNPPARNWVVYNKNSIREKLEAEIANTGPARPLKDIAKDLGYHHPTSLSRPFPELCQAIVMKYRNYQKTHPKRLK